MPKSKIRDKAEIDAQITHGLQAEEQAKEQCQNFKTVRQTNQSVQASCRQNGKHPSLGQVRSNRYSGYSQAERGF